MNNILTIQRAGRKPGSRASENQDRILARQLELGDGGSGAFLVVADGITNCSYGGSVARWVVDRNLAATVPPINDDSNLTTAFRGYLSSLYAKFNLEFKDLPDMLASGCCIVSIVIAGSRWVCCSVGDCQAFLLTKNEIGYEGRQITRPHIDRYSGKLTDCFGTHAPCNFNTYHGEIRNGDVVVLTSDGAKLNEGSLPEDLQRHGFSDRWLNELADRAKNGCFWDDISIVAYQHHAEDRSVP